MDSLISREQIQNLNTFNEDYIEQLSLSGSVNELLSYVVTASSIVGERYSFKVNDVKYDAIVKIRSPVTDIKNTIARYEYLRPTKTYVLSFPSS